MRPEEYPQRAREMATALGSQSALCRALGISSNAMVYRIDHPASVKREHCLALELLELRIAGQLPSSVLLSAQR